MSAGPDARVAQAFGVEAAALHAQPRGGEGDALQRTAFAAARALGFVEREAQVLARMCAAHAARLPADAPLDGFALRPDNLPVARGAPPFAPLAHRDMGLYAVVDSAEWVRRVLDAGVRTVQLRIKDAPAAVLDEAIRASVAAARAAGAQLFVNDHWAPAIEHGAYGVHLGQEDLDGADLGAIRAAGLRLGVSTHAFWEVCEAVAAAPSYIACGPIHATRLKRMPWIPQGEDNLAYWCALLDVPVVAIGGLDAPRAREAARCGAAGIAVVSAITGAAQPEAAIAVLQAAIGAGRAEPARAPPALPRPTLG